MNNMYISTHIDVYHIWSIYFLTYFRGKCHIILYPPQLCHIFLQLFSRLFYHLLFYYYYFYFYFLYYSCTEYLCSCFPSFCWHYQFSVYTLSSSISQNNNTSIPFSYTHCINFSMDTYIYTYIHTHIHIKCNTYTHLYTLYHPSWFCMALHHL